MVSKNWLWVVIAGLVIVTVHQIMTLPGGGSAESQPPEAEQALEPDGQTMHMASLGELPGMLPEKR